MIVSQLLCVLGTLLCQESMALAERGHVKDGLCAALAMAACFVVAGYLLAAL